MDELYNKLVAVAASIDIQAADVADGVYYGKANRYVVVRMQSAPTFYGNDNPLVDRYSFYFDVYVPMNEQYRHWVSAVRLALESAGATEVSYQGQEQDTDVNLRCVMFNGTYDIYRED